MRSGVARGHALHDRLLDCRQVVLYLPNRGLEQDFLGRSCPFLSCSWL